MSEQEQEVGTTEDERPTWLPDKFSTPEQMVESYAQLETKLSQGGSNEQVVEPDTPEQESLVEGLDTTTEDEVEAVHDFSLDTFQNEYVETGALSEESLDKIVESTSMSRDDVTDFIAFKRQQGEAAVYESVGGYENYKKGLDYLNSRPLAERVAFNETLQSNDVSKIIAAAKDIFIKAQGANTKPNLAQGVKGIPTSDGLNTMAQLKTAQRSVEYQTDPKFRDTVLNKIRALNA